MAFTLGQFASGPGMLSLGAGAAKVGQGLSQYFSNGSFSPSSISSLSGMGANYLGQALGLPGPASNILGMGTGALGTAISGSMAASLPAGIGAASEVAPIIPAGGFALDGAASGAAAGAGASAAMAAPAVGMAAMTLANIMFGQGGIFWDDSQDNAIGDYYNAANQANYDRKSSASGDTRYAYKAIPGQDAPDGATSYSAFTDSAGDGRQTFEPEPANSALFQTQYKYNKDGSISEVAPNYTQYWVTDAPVSGYGDASTLNGFSFDTGHGSAVEKYANTGTTNYDQYTADQATQQAAQQAQQQAAQSAIDAANGPAFTGTLGFPQLGNNSPSPWAGKQGTKNLTNNIMNSTMAGTTALDALMSYLNQYAGTNQNSSRQVQLPQMGNGGVNSAALNAQRAGLATSGLNSLGGIGRSTLADYFKDTGNAPTGDTSAIDAMFPSGPTSGMQGDALTNFLDSSNYGGYSF